MNEITHKSRLQCFAVFHPCVGFRSEEAFTERQRKVGKWRKVSQEVSSSLRLFSLSEMNFVFPRGVGWFHLAEIKWQWWILAHFNFYSVSARLLIKSPSSDTNRNFSQPKVPKEISDSGRMLLRLQLRRDYFSLISFRRTEAFGDQPIFPKLQT